MTAGPKVHVFFKAPQELLMLSKVLELLPRSISALSHRFISFRPHGSLDGLLQGIAASQDWNGHLVVTQHLSRHLCPKAIFIAWNLPSYLLNPLSPTSDVSSKGPSKSTQDRWASSTPSL